MTAVRLIGEHHDDTVLTVADEAIARTNPNTVTIDHARKLVACGEAEWIREPLTTLADEHQIDHPGRCLE